MSKKRRKKARQKLAKKGLKPKLSKNMNLRRTVHLPNSTTDFRILLHELEKKPDFELSPPEKTAVRQLQKVLNTKIEAWSFVPHPDVINAVQGEAQRLIRYIFTIDTLMAKAFVNVQEFLQAQKINVNSYFSGGWADFVCEAHLTEKQFNSLLDKVKGILLKAGAPKLVESGKVEDLISVFRVEKTLILCGNKISAVASPDPGILEEIKSEPVKFEVVYRNYRSDEAKKYFSNGEKGLRAYIKRLEAGHVILCYKVVFDRTRHFEWDYVPVQRVKRLLHLGGPEMQQPKFLKPIVDLVEVTPINTVDSEEAEVTHIFINEYDFPGERQDWKRRIYESLGDNANLYTYPLEGTLNESPIYLSDVPETLERAAGYKVGDVLIGVVHHPLIKAPPEIKLGINSFSNHGVTFGIQGRGKTYTDMVLIEQVAAKIGTVLILDASGSVSGKLPLINPTVRQRIKQIKLPFNSNREAITAAIELVLKTPGLYLIEPDGSNLPKVFDVFVEQLQKMPDPTTGDRNREIGGFLLIEEANDVFGNTEQSRDERLRNLEALLNKAGRKGWSIWLSTQHPSQLGRDDDTRLRILRELKNRILHAVGGENEINLVLKSIESEGATADDRAYVEQTLKALNQSEEKGSAIFFGTENNDQGTHMRPISVKVHKLAMSST